MRVVIFSTNPKNFYSGGRYHGAMAAVSLAVAGANVTYVTNNIPIFFRDLAHVTTKSPVEVLVSSNWVENMPSGPADIVLLVPTTQLDQRFYMAARSYAERAGARLAMINFESPNWYNALVTPKRDEVLWAEWAAACEDGCLVLSSCEESDRWAREYYTHYPDRTRFAVWKPPINGAALEAAPVCEHRDQVFVMVRSADLHKGAADALALISPRFKGETFTFLFGGELTDKQFEADLSAAADAAGVRLRILRALTDLQKFAELRRSKALVFPSVFEGYGLPPLEAMAAGAPPICYDLPVLRELCGDAAIYAPVGDLNALTENLWRVLQDGGPEQATFRAQVGDLADPPARGQALVEIFENYLRTAETSSSQKPLTLKAGISDARSYANQFAIVRGFAEQLPELKSLIVEVAGTPPVQAVLGFRREDVKAALGAHHDRFGFTAIIQGPLQDALFSRLTLAYTDRSGREGQLASRCSWTRSDAAVPHDNGARIDRVRVDEDGVVFVEGVVSGPRRTISVVSVSHEGRSLRVGLGTPAKTDDVPFVASGRLDGIVPGSDATFVVTKWLMPSKLQSITSIVAPVRRLPQSESRWLAGQEGALKDEAVAVAVDGIKARLDKDRLTLAGGIRTLRNLRSVALRMVNASSADGRLARNGIEWTFEIDVAVKDIPRESPLAVEVNDTAGQACSLDVTQLVWETCKSLAPLVLAADGLLQRSEGPKAEKLGEAGLSDAVANREWIRLRGWAAAVSPDMTIEIQVNGRTLGCRTLNMQRKDIFERFEQYRHSDCCYGFDFAIRHDNIENPKVNLIYRVAGQIFASIETRLKITPDATIKEAKDTEKVIGDLEWHSPRFRRAALKDQRRNVVVAMHIMPLPETQGNRRVVMQLLRYLRSIDMMVTVVIQQNVQLVLPIIDDLCVSADRVIVADPTIPRPNKRSRTSPADRYFQGTADALEALQAEAPIATLIVQYIHMATALQVVPDTVTKVIQTHDVLSRLPAQFAAIGEQVPGDRAVSPLDEARFLDHAHVVLAISDEEACELRRLAPAKHIVTVGFAHERSDRSALSKGRRGRVVLFVGSANLFNVAGLRRFVANSWLSVLKRVPDATLRVVGDVGPQAFPAGAPEGVDILGRVPDLDAEYHAADVVVNCTWNGTGLKIKTVEALGFGKAVVLTDNACEGVPAYDSPPYKIAANDEEFADAIVDTLVSEDQRVRLEASARRYADNHLGLQTVFSPLRAILAAPHAPGRRTAAVDRRTRDLVFDAMDALPRTMLGPSFGVLLGSDIVLGSYMAEWAFSRGMKIGGVFSDQPDTVLTRPDLRVEPIELIDPQRVPRLLVGSTNAAELATLERVAHGRGIDTLTLKPRTRLKDRRRLAELAGIHAGRRCFILGNGPSVRFEDLKRLQGEITFAANRFHLAYPQTSFRPTYTACSDMLMAEQNGQQIVESCETPLFMEVRAARRVATSFDGDVIAFDVLPRPVVATGIGMAFTSDATVGLGNGGSIIYDLIQLAVWMGISEVYLYGIDHTFRVPGIGAAAVRDGGEQNHFIANYRRSSELWYPPARELIDAAFSAARTACEERGVVIRNATRGGALEIFERADFDSVLGGDMQTKRPKKRMPRRTPSRDGSNAVAT